MPPRRMHKKSDDAADRNAGGLIFIADIVAAGII
jgi:hypothetical protein